MVRLRLAILHLAVLHLAVLHFAERLLQNVDPDSLVGGGRCQRDLAIGEPRHANAFRGGKRDVGCAVAVGVEHAADRLRIAIDSRSNHAHEETVPQRALFDAVERRAAVACEELAGSLLQMRGKTRVIGHKSRLPVVQVVAERLAAVPLFGQRRLILGLFEQVGASDGRRRSVGPQIAVNRGDSRRLEAADRRIGNQSIDFIGRKPAVPVLVPVREVPIDDFREGLLCAGGITGPLRSARGNLTGCGRHSVSVVFRVRPTDEQTRDEQQRREKQRSKLAGRHVVNLYLSKADYRAGRSAAIP